MQASVVEGGEGCVWVGLACSARVVSVSARAPPKKMPAATAPKMMNAVCINGMIKRGSYMTRHWERRKSQ